MVPLTRALVLCAVLGCGKHERTEITTLAAIDLDVVLAPPEIDRLLDETHASDVGTDFDVAANGDVVLRIGDALLEVRSSGGDVTVDRLAEHGAPDHFAVDQDTLLGVRGRMLGTLDHGALTESVPLPVEGMRLVSATTPGVVHLFGGTPLIARRVYALHETGELDVVAELPAPVVAVADGASALYVATTDEVWRVRADRIELVTKVAAPITSIAITPNERVLFIASGNEILAMHGLVAVPLVENARGELRWRLGALWLWDAQRKLLARMTRVGDELIGGSAS